MHAKPRLTHEDKATVKYEYIATVYTINKFFGLVQHLRSCFSLAEISNPPCAPYPYPEVADSLLVGEPSEEQTVYEMASYNCIIVLQPLVTTALPACM